MTESTAAKMCRRARWGSTFYRPFLDIRYTTLAPRFIVLRPPQGTLFTVFSSSISLDHTSSFFVVEECISLAQSNILHSKQSRMCKMCNLLQTRNEGHCVGLSSGVGESPHGPSLCRDFRPGPTRHQFPRRDEIDTTAESRAA